jgi:hypothetical protein
VGFPIEDWLPHRVLLIKHFSPEGPGHLDILHQLTHLPDVHLDAAFEVMIDQCLKLLQLEFQLELFEPIYHLLESEEQFATRLMLLDQVTQVMLVTHTAYLTDNELLQLSKVNAMLLAQLQSVLIVQGTILCLGISHQLVLLRDPLLERVGKDIDFKGLFDGVDPNKGFILELPYNLINYKFSHECW